ncbi:prenyltransferase [Aliidiomarina quisquiliarum]|uniref:prenyltransferase n=1 Tax=Aliidiomarina quisquiliarum TaxID=2938947 RepID=UPI00208F1C92|nr:prenyltransferase [Aliidiomarina quisquiliarum]
MLKTVSGVARLNFLTLTLLCVLLALAYSLAAGVSVQLLPFIVVSVIALAAHASVNAFNEYFDFRSGLDFLTPKTPFSGGSGTLIRAPEKARWALTFAWITLGLVVLGGLFLVSEHGWPLLWIGVPGVIIIYSYTQYINRLPIICLVAPGIGFGLLMTLGAIWVFQGSLNIGAWALAIVVSLLVSNLLLLNQFPDADADRKVGRRTLPIVLGKERSAVVFALQYGLAMALHLIAIAVAWLPAPTIIALLSLPILIKLVPGVYNNKGSVIKLTPFLGLNVIFIHLYLLLLVAGLIWAWW